MNRYVFELKKVNLAVEQAMRDAYWKWIDAHFPNEKPRLQALSEERARLRARIVEIETELMKHAPDVYDAAIDMEGRKVEPFLTQFAVERREGDEE